MSGMENEARSTTEAAILVVDANPESLASIGEALETQGWRSEKMGSSAAAAARLKEKEYAVIIIGANTPDASELELLKLAKAMHPETEVLLVSADGTGNSASLAMSLGAFDCLDSALALDANRLVSSVQDALRKKALRGTDADLTEPIEPGYFFENIVGRCDQMQDIFRLITKLAPATVPVIIQGESGTGKELVARAIHNISGRRNQKFLAINSASLPATLLESELFGYRKGAFTGARTDKIGLLESANRGTLFLDEIGAMSKHLQGKLLRAMQEGEIMPVGSLERVKVDVRFLAASNRNLAEMVEAGDFRKDLYYRLNVIEISLPPLRGRSQDIPLLAEHFLQKYSREQGVAPKVLGKPAMRKLLKHRWPGNVRELENVIRRALIVSSGPVIKAHDIDISRPLSANISGRSDLFSMSYREAKKVVQSEFQRAYVRRLLSECEGSVSKAAHRAGLSRWAIHQMAKRYGLK